MPMCKGCKMSSSGSSNCWLINWNNCSIGMCNKAKMCYTMSNSNRSNCTICTRGISNSSLCSKMVSTCSSYSRLISRNYSSVRMSYKVGVQVKRSSITTMNNCRDSSMCNCSMSISCMSNYSFCCKMISSGSSNSRFINRNNSSIRMSYQAIE